MHDDMTNPSKYNIFTQRFFILLLLGLLLGCFIWSIYDDYVIQQYKTKIAIYENQKTHIANSEVFQNTNLYDICMSNIYIIQTAVIKFKPSLNIDCEQDGTISVYKNAQ
jgi:hypothetical protein